MGTEKKDITERISDRTYGIIGLAAVLLIIAIIAGIFVFSIEPSSNGGTDEQSAQVSSSSQLNADSSSEGGNSDEDADNSDEDTESSLVEADNPDEDADSSLVEADNPDEDSESSSSTDSDVDEDSDSSSSADSDADEGSGNDVEIEGDDETKAKAAADAYCAERVEKHNTISAINYNDSYKLEGETYYFEYTIEYTNGAESKIGNVLVEKDSNGKFTAKRMSLD